MTNCVICETPNVGEQQLGGHKGYTCARCGLYAVLNEKRSPFPDQLRYFLEAQGANVALRRSRLSHIVRRAQDGRRYIGIPVNDIGSWGLDDPLPSPGEQFDNLVLWTGDHQPNYAESVTIRPPEMAAWMGAPVGVNPSQIMGWILAQGGAGDLIEQRMEALRLTLKGWERYRTLKDTVTASRAAFMAMKFGDEQLNAAVETCFKPAVSAAGFELRTIAEGQSAGLIDDQIRVAIRRSKFVVADLTHGNNGAYWEAGFAEGAGKPVIYTCHADAWSKEKTHFDTNHLATIIWHPEELPDAGRRLKAMIQATFPADATME